MKFLMHQAIKYLSLLLIVVLLASCSAMRSNSLREVSIEATANANRSMPVALDLLFISDSTLLPQLTSLSGPEWFANKQQLMMIYQQQVLLASFEIVPSSVISSVLLPEGHKSAETVIMFVNYPEGEGQYAAELSNFKQLNIRLERERYQLLEITKE